MSEEEKPEALSIDEIVANQKPQSKPGRIIGFPVGVGDTGMSLGRMGRQRSYSRDDTENVPSGETVGARVVQTPRVPK